MKKDDKRRNNESGKEIPLGKDDPFSPDDDPRREVFYRQDGPQMPVSGSGCRIRKSYDRERDHTSYHYDCGEGLLPSNEIFSKPCIKEKALVDRAFPPAPRLGSLSANNKEIKHEELFPELEKDPFLDMKEEERPFSEMLRALGSKNSPPNSNSQAPNKPFHDELNYRGCPISERWIFHLRDQLDGCSNDFSDECLPCSPLEREVALEQGALDSLFDFFDDLVVEEDAGFSFTVFKQAEKKEAYVEQVQLIQLEWSK